MDTQTTVLDSDLNPITEFDPRHFTVTAGVRLGNYILDIVIFYALIFLLVIILTASGVQIPSDDSSLQILALLLLFLYYLIFESTLGKTPAKFITRCRVVNDQGKPASPISILGRTLSRFVPLDALTFLGGDARGWHDRWSNTWVISEKRLNELKSGSKVL